MRPLRSVSNVQLYRGVVRVLNPQNSVGFSIYQARVPYLLTG